MMIRTQKGEISVCVLGPSGPTVQVHLNNLLVYIPIKDLIRHWMRLGGGVK